MFSSMFFVSAIELLAIIAIIILPGFVMVK